MKKITLILGFLAFCSSSAWAQFTTWQNPATSFLYDFSGNREAGATTAKDINNVNYNNRSDATTPGWLPAPSSGYAFLRGQMSASAPGNNAQFKLKLDDDTNPIGLLVRTPLTGVTKVSLVDVGNASEIARFSTTLNFSKRLGGTAKTIMHLFIGSSLGNTNSIYQSTTNVSTADIETSIFALLRFQYNDVSGEKVAFAVRRYQNETVGFASFTNVVFDINKDYHLEIIANNSNQSQQYTYAGSTVILAPATYHIYVDNSIIGNTSGNHEFPSATILTSQPGTPSIGLAVGNKLDALGLTFTTGNSDETITPIFGISNIRLDYAVSTTLPVSLTAFTAKNQNELVKLNWSTASEHNNSHFDILRSRDGGYFSKIGKIDGKGNSDQLLNYSYTDYSPLAGTSYYRLNQVDFDGTTTPSETVSVKRDLKDDNAFSVFLNRDQGLEVAAYSTKGAKGTLQVTNIAGQSVLVKEIELTEGYNKFEFNLPFESSGAYIATLISEGKAKSVKFIK